MIRECLSKKVIFETDLNDRKNSAMGQFQVEVLILQIGNTINLSTLTLDMPFEHSGNSFMYADHTFLTCTAHWIFKMVSK